MVAFLSQIERNLTRYAGKTAFVIDGVEFSYQDLSERITVYQNGIANQCDSSSIAVVVHNHIDTYAAIFAIWFSGKTFVPIHPDFPVSRLQGIIHKSNCQCFIDPLNTTDLSLFKIEPTTHTQIRDTKILHDSIENPLYILFTSGSTGQPKGVPIMPSQFQAFIDNGVEAIYDLSADDRFLQVYELTFDGAFQSYVVPMLHGASVYTADTGKMKFMTAIELMIKHKITHIKMTPSMLRLIKPWLAKIQLPSLKYSVFGGEALYADDVIAWMRSAYNSIIVNVYGPTETSVNISSYSIFPGSKIEFNNGIVALGKLHKGLDFSLINKNLNPGINKGELCVAGTQVFNGYVEESENNFVKVNGLIYYRTGDLVELSEDGMMFFKGRTDSQVQYNGYRIELGDIESTVKVRLNLNSVAFVSKTATIDELVLCVEGQSNMEDELSTVLKKYLPFYMMPARVNFMNEFPRLVSGKTDRVSVINNSIEP